MAAKDADVRAHAAAAEAEDHLAAADAPFRAAVRLLWRGFGAGRPLMTLINGKCRGVGCGLALLPQYAALRDSTEFVHDGPDHGLTPFGGLTHFLARTETSLKYPGLAEFVMLTGTPLYAGDALRLGWSDLFSTLPDLEYQIRDWFNDTEHMHNDAVAWQLGYLLDTVFKMKQHHATSMERTALTPARARWIEEVFADQAAVEGVLASLTAVEALPLSDPANTADANLSAVATLPSVAAGVAALSSHELRRWWAVEEPLAAQATGGDAEYCRTLKLWTRAKFKHAT